MNKQIAKYLTIPLLAAAFGFSAPVNAATTDLSTQPMAVTSNLAIKPNLLFLLDDSGSMAWDRLSPDTMAQTTDSSQGSCVAGTNGQQGSCMCNMNSSFNGVYYNPAYTYVLPVTSTGTNYVNSTFTSAKDDGFDITSPTSTNLSTGFKTGGSNNNSFSLISGAVTASNAGGPAFYFNYRPTAVATITVSGTTTTSTSVTGITVGGAQIMSAASATSTTTSTVATNIASKINACSAAITGSCTVAGYSATASGSTVTIIGSAATVSFTPVITFTGSMTIAASGAFVSNGTPSTPKAGTCYPDINYTKVVVTPPPATVATLTVVGTSGITVTSIKVNNVDLMSGASSASNSSIATAAYIAARITQNGFSATSTDNTVRIIGPATANTFMPIVTQSGTGMTITADGPMSSEAQSYANWYSYYRTRILTMKSAAGRAFAPIDSTFRVGFTKINSITGGTPLVDNISDFDATQKAKFYTDFYAVTPNSSTPLRVALADAGRIFAHKLTGAADPMQYSCQQNFTIMTTDGMWNETTNPTQLDGTTDIGNQDNTAPRPMYDGTSYTQTTTQRQKSTTTTYSNTSQLVAQQTQSRTSTLQSTTYPLQSSISNLQSSTWPLQSSTAPLQSSTWPLQSSTSNLQSQAWQLQSRTKSGGTWGSWGNATSCTYSSSVQCQYVAGTLSTVASCTTIAKTTSTSNGTVYTVAPVTCGYAAYTAAAPAGSCTYQNQSGGSPYAGPAVTCSYGATPTVTTVTSCTPVAKSTSTTNGAVWDATAHSCGYGAYSAAAPASSCTYQNQSGGSPYAGPAVTCSYGATPTVATVTSCTPVAKSTSTTNGAVWDATAHSCGYSAWSAWANASSCTIVAQSTAPSYTVATATDCQTPWIGVSSCTAGTGGVLACNTINTSTAVASCTPVTASSANSWTATTCPPATVTPWVGVSSCTTAAASSSNSYVATNCNTATATATVGSCTAAAAAAANNWTATACSGMSGGTPNTLADVAYYYYQTDLRNSALSNCTGALGTDVCFDNVRGVGIDSIQQQHMTTFTLGLGVVGTLDPDNPKHYYPYPPSGSTDFQNLITGPNNWPAPVSNTDTTIDDLWHAAVNGRGQYFSAKDPDSLVKGLSGALEAVKTLKGSSAAASTSNMQPVPGDNYAYIALFNTLAWDGDLISKEIDPSTGQFVKDLAGKDKIDWQAQPLLETLVSPISDTRTIYTFDSSVSAAQSKLKQFTWANLTATEQGYFSNMCTSPFLLSQCSTLIANDVTNGTATAAAASGANLVNFLRGQRGFEDAPGNNGTVYGNGTVTYAIYRPRDHVLGDIVSAQPQYVKRPPFDYADSGYSDFKTAQAGRTPMVYSGANDGMLHAFDAATGIERWAYIPPMVLPNLYRLASEDYPNNHRYYVDGTPTVVDVCPSAPASACTGAQWKTILVAGLNGGGRGYYALDITDPASPKALWNFTVNDNDNVGYSYGNPVIAKRKDNCDIVTGICTGGTWVVGLTSGYNNVSPGDGKGHLFILNAYYGGVLNIVTNKHVPLEDIVTIDTTTATFTGDTTTPSGFARINAFVENPADNTVEHFYGGDLLGNVWRLSIDSTSPPSGKGPFLLAMLGKVDLAYSQPVTIRPELSELVDSAGATHAIVQIATGRYLGVSDLANTDQQSVYSFKDDITTTPLGLVRTPGKLVKQTLTTYTSGGKFYRRGSNTAVDWATKSGWYVDLNPNGDSPGERVNVDMNQQQTTLSVIGNVPDTNACNVGGYSWIYYFNFQTGYLAPLAGIRDATNSMIAGTTQIMDQSGKTHTIVTHTDGTVSVQDDISPAGVLGVSRRTSWRELTY